MENRVTLSHLTALLGYLAAVIGGATIGLGIVW